MPTHYIYLSEVLILVCPARHWSNTNPIRSPCLISKYEAKKERENTVSTTYVSAYPPEPVNPEVTKQLAAFYQSITASCLVDRSRFLVFIKIYLSRQYDQ
jgi:hypothetical protein